MTTWSELSAKAKASLVQSALKGNASLSASEIAELVGAPTRNCIIGVAYRNRIQLAVTSGGCGGGRRVTDYSGIKALAS